jgi:glycosyltransferase involved in cell wall biosynthesis
MRISVIIPTFNRSRLICRAIDSVLAQTCTPDEIIVVDDGSTDDTFEKLQQQYPTNIKVYRCSENRGVSAARNLGIERSTGDWIALLDSDDEWLPDKLAQQVSALHKNPLPVCHTDEIWIRKGVRVNQMKKHRKFGGDIFKHCLAMCAMSPSSIMLEKRIVLEAGGFDETLPACEDYDLWLKICAQTPVLYLQQPLIRKYGGHEDQLSAKHWGMDRFRIQSLDALLQTNVLCEEKRNLAIETLLRKLNILRKGAEKHNNQTMLSYCDLLLLKYQ